MGTAALRTCRAVAPLLFIALCMPALSSSAIADAGPWLLRLERGDSLQVVRLEPATFGMFRYVRTDSVEGYLSGHKVRSILDADGLDLGRTVLERRRAIGVDPATYRRDGSSNRLYHRGSRREARGFPLFEVGVYGRVNGPDSPYDGTSLLMSLDLGAMRNLSPSYSMGATLHFEADDEREGFGLALRGRRWLDNELSLDGTAGWMFAGSDDRGDFRANAFYGEASVNLGDHVQLAARIESWKGPARYDAYPDSSYFGGSIWRPSVVEATPKRETLIHIGAKVGSFPSILALLVVLALVDINPPPPVY